MIDTHCHLNFKAFNKDIDDVVRRFQKKGGEHLLVVGAKIDSSEKAVAIANKYSNVYASVGIHPHHVQTVSLSKAEEKLNELVKEKKVVAIGETGFDNYQYNNYPPLSQKDLKLQKELFLLHINLARKHNLPVIIHCRNAQNKLLNILQKQKIIGVVHCFEGTLEYLAKILDLGLYVGFDGNITYKENSQLRALVYKTPLNRLLLETDSPYLTPLPYRGQRNEPANLEFIVKCIAQEKKEDEKSIIEKTSQNAHLLFNFIKPKLKN